MMQDLVPKLRAYYLVSILSIVIAVVGFSYNTWRLEVSEENATIRTAAFELYLHLAELEAILYAANYDHDFTAGSPRKAWVKVGLIVDLSHLVSLSVEQSALELKQLWQISWQSYTNNDKENQQIIDKIEQIRNNTKQQLLNLQ